MCSKRTTSERPCGADGMLGRPSRSPVRGSGMWAGRPLPASHRLHDFGFANRIAASASTVLGTLGSHT